MADQQFCLRWNEHTGTMVKVFKQMLESQAFVDCTLACEGKVIKAHKMILAACSPYLHTILEENTSKHPIIFLPHLKYTDIKALVDYMYCGEVYISFGHLPSLLKAAEVLRIKGLTDVTNGNSNNNNNNNINNNNNNNNNNINNINNNLTQNNIINNDNSNNNGSSRSNISSNSELNDSGISSLGNPTCDQNQINAVAAAAAAAAAAAGADLGQILGNNLKTSSNLLDQSYEEEENDYEMGLQIAIEPEMSFVDDNSNEEQNNEEVSSGKTFVCHLCRCSFTAQSSLRRHMHRHYTDRERFECEICHNSYSRKDYLKEHKKTKHQLST